MRMGKLGLVVVAVVGALVGCSDRVASATSDDMERATLVARTLALKDSAAVTGRLSSTQRQELADLVQDIADWQARTGRTDLSVSAPHPITRAATNAVPVPGAPGDRCAPCPGYTVTGDYVCFLVEEGDCPDEDSFIGKSCLYRCIWIGSGSPTPIKRR